MDQKKLVTCRGCARLHSLTHREVACVATGRLIQMHATFGVVPESGQLRECSMYLPRGDGKDHVAQRLIDKAKKQLEGLDASGRLSDKQLSNLLTRCPSEVSVPLAVHELGLRRGNKAVADAAGALLKKAEPTGCTFCGRDLKDVYRLVQCGPENIHGICDGCLRAAWDLLRKEGMTPTF